MTKQFDKSYWERLPRSQPRIARALDNLQICAQHLYDFISQTDANPGPGFQIPITPANANANANPAHENGKGGKNTHALKKGKERRIVEDEIDIVTTTEHL